MGAAAAAALVALFLALGFRTRSAEPKVPQLCDLTVNHEENPLGIDDETICFGWKTAGQEHDIKQLSYRIRVKEEGVREVWDSGVVDAEESANIRYEGEDLQPCTRYEWSVTSELSGGKKAKSDTAWFETGMLGAQYGDRLWGGAEWIAAPEQEETTEESAEEDSDGDAESFGAGGEEETGIWQYTIEATAQLPEEFGGFGLVWGYRETDHSMYQLELSPDSETDSVHLTLRYIRKYMNEWSDEMTAKGLRPSGLSEAPFRLQIAVDRENVKAFVDDELIWETVTPDARSLSCGFGIHHYRGSTGYCGEFRVLDADGSTVMSESFDDAGRTIFGEQSLNITEDGILVSSGELLLAKKDAKLRKPAPMLRKSFVLDPDRKVKRARLYATACGIYECTVNGEPVTNTRLNPGNIPYNLRSDYRTYDVTELLRQGDNCIGTVLGHGWYDRAVGFDGIGMIWGEDISFYALLTVEYDDGTVLQVPTDASWLVYEDGPVRDDDLWQGEWYDAGKEVPGWDLPDFMPEGDWKPARILDRSWPGAVLRAAEDPPVVTLEPLLPVAVTRLTDQITVCDFGQEISGVCEVNVSGQEGARIVLRHGEWLNDEKMADADAIPGSVYTRNLLGARSADCYILRGDTGDDGEALMEQYSPTLVFHGFRYLQIETGDPSVTIGEVRAIPYTSELPGMERAVFETSNSYWDRLYENCLWTYLDNTLSIPTDCPQRSERFGWSGDAQIGAGYGTVYGDVARFFSGYVQDLLDTQDEGTGSVADMAPRNGDTTLEGRGGNGGHSAWGDAIILIPWQLYQYYGDTALLERAYPGMKAWAEYLIFTEQEVFTKEEGYGDLYALDDTAIRQVNSAYLVHSLDLMAKIAQVTGHEEEAPRYLEEAAAARELWSQLFAGEEQEEQLSQGVLTLGLAFSLFPDEQRMAELLAAKLDEGGEILKTGFTSTPYVLDVLCSEGYPDLAWKVLSREGLYTYWYEIANGGTTMWESMQGLMPVSDEKYRVVGSLNHLARGAVGGWLVRGGAGIRPDPDHPGFQQFLLEPAIPSEEIAGASAPERLRLVYPSQYGDIVSEWYWKDGEAHYHAVVPAGCRARLILPKWWQEEQLLTSGEWDFTFTPDREE